jgi:branched-chain amino acid transport system ATP-binding protein
MNGLSVEGLRAGYTHVPILHGITLSVGPGEMVGIFGANGAGKTTLLRAIAGAIQPSAGRIDLFGRDITRAAPWKRVRAGLAHVPEGRHVLGPLTVADNLRVAALPAGKQARQIEEVFELFPVLGARQDQRGGTLSGGEQQMLAVARSLMARPRVLLVDELSSGLAPVVARMLVDRLRRVCDEGTGIVAVEQSPSLIAHVIDRCYLLEHGTTVAEGSLAELGGAERLADTYLGVH